MWVWALLACVCVIAVMALMQYRGARGMYRPMSSRQPSRVERKVPLGMEALDLESVSRVTRRNESLERGQTNWLRGTGFFGRSDTDVAPLADDETYSARYHAAFQRKQKKD